MKVGIGLPSFIKNTSSTLECNLKICIADINYYTSELFQYAFTFPEFAQLQNKTAFDVIDFLLVLAYNYCIKVTCNCQAKKEYD